MCHFIFVYDSHVSWSILSRKLLKEHIEKTKMNAVQNSLENTILF